MPGDSVRAKRDRSRASRESSEPLHSYAFAQFAAKLPFPRDAAGKWHPPSTRCVGGAHDRSRSLHWTIDYLPAGPALTESNAQPLVFRASPSGPSTRPGPG